MTFTKRTLAKSYMGYSVYQHQLLGEKRPIAASESTGPALVFLGEEFTPTVISEEPGGTMGFASVPGRDDALFAVTEFYPIFKAEASGVTLFEAVDGFNAPWKGTRVIDLPFVHRIETVATPSGSFLITATICGGKDFQDDWSRPGVVLAHPVDSNGLSGSEPLTILEGIHKNHGLCTGTINGLEYLLVAGTEGLFTLTLPGQHDSNGAVIPPWQVEQMLSHEVSEMGMIDLDGDGELELIVIEPFHGDTFAVYKLRGGSWERVFTSELAFGHGLAVGEINGEKIAIVGNRAGDMNLVCFTAGTDDPFRMERSVIDEGAATAGISIVNTQAGDGIITSNPGFEEYALYIAKGEK
jgi:hypothetical protein